MDNTDRWHVRNKQNATIATGKTREFARKAKRALGAQGIDCKIVDTDKEKLALENTQVHSDCEAGYAH